MVNKFIKRLAFMLLLSELLMLSHLMSVPERYKFSDKASSPHSIGVSLVKFDNSVSVDSMCHKEHESPFFLFQRTNLRHPQLFMNVYCIFLIFTIRTYVSS